MAVLDSVFDVPLTHEDSMDESDEGFEQGDCPMGTLEDDPTLTPLLRIKKYSHSTNILNRQMAVRIVKELLRTVPAEALAKDLPDIMKELTRIGEESILRVDLLEQIPHIAAQTIECSSKLGDLRNKICDYLIPLVVRNLGCLDAAADKAAHTALIQLIEQGFITKQQVEIQVCPSILALSKLETTTDISASAGAITLMSRLAQHLGRDVMERVFLKRFTELCANQRFYVRKICAANFGDFCNVVGPNAFENVLLPSYISLCEDGVWGVRKACAEVVMYVSCSCPPKCRKEILAPVFVKLLQDECRWVRMAAYQALGPLIATFADPTLIKVAYNTNGDLVLVNREGEEFKMNCSRSMSVSDAFMINRENREKNVDIIVNPLSLGINDLNSTDLHEESREDQYLDRFMKFQDMLETKENLSKVNLNEKSSNEDQCCNGFMKLDVLEKEETINKDLDESFNTDVYNANLWKFQDNVNVINQQVHCDNLTKKIDNELSKEMCSLNISDNIDNGNSERNKSISISSIKDVNDNDKVNNVDLEDDLSLFHSHVYWYINPDLPLDPSIIAGHDIPVKDDPPGYIKQCAEISNFIETVVGDDSTLSLEYDKNIDNKTEEISSPLVHSLPEQDVIPQPLIEHFVSMTDRNFCLDIDTEITYHCAYSLPAVALTLGKDNWYLLKDTVECLAGDMQYKIRKTVACGLHELAIILGPKIATESLTPLFDGFIKDLDEVRIGVLKHLADFLKLIETEKRISYLPKLTQFLRTDNEWNWRFRYELAEQLLQAVTLFKPSDTAKYLGVIAIDLLCDKVAAVREITLLLVTRILSYISSEPGLTPNLLIKLAEHFAHSKKWKRRQTFCLLCCELLRQKTLSPEQFATDVMPHLLDLSWDPVTNVRLVVARCLAKYLITNDYFTNPANGHCDGLETVLRRLQSDKDQDVRHATEFY